MLILDNLDNPDSITQGNNWQFCTEGVMGKLSSG